LTIFYTLAQTQAYVKTCVEMINIQFFITETKLLAI
jgi:hypothetical protein